MISFEFLASVAPILAFGGLGRFRRNERALGTKNLTGLEISPGVRIWYVLHCASTNGARHCATVTQQDTAEFAAIRDLDIRNRSLSTRGALRRALTEAVGGSIAPEAWNFRRDEVGKPALGPGFPTLSFSCSHTEWASIIAVSASKDVGIDIEAADFPVSGQWLADTFTTSERSIVNALPPSDQKSAIARLWTLKEAYLKMLGTGIADALEVAFDPRNDRLVSGQTSCRARPRFRTWVANCQGHPLTVAVAISDPTTKGALWRQWNEECRVRLRAIFEFFGQRADQGSTPAASLLRSAGAAAAGSSGG